MDTRPQGSFCEVCKPENKVDALDVYLAESGLQYLYCTADCVKAIEETLELSKQRLLTPGGLPP